MKYIGKYFSVEQLLTHYFNHMMRKMLKVFLYYYAMNGKIKLIRGKQKNINIILI